jgi:hypothetical protein
LSNAIIILLRIIVAKLSYLTPAAATLRHQLVAGKLTLLPAVALLLPGRQVAV